VRRFAFLLMIPLLAGCSNESAEQIASTAGMGAALGIPGGPIGVAVGGILGAAAGVIMPPGSLDEPPHVATKPASS